MSTSPFQLTSTTLRAEPSPKGCRLATGSEEPRGDHEYEHLFARVHLAAVHHKYAHVDLFPTRRHLIEPTATGDACESLQGAATPVLLQACGRHVS